MSRGLGWLLLPWCIPFALALACSDGAQATAATKPGAASPTPPPTPSEAAQAAQAADEEQKRIDAEFPLHGLVTGTQLKVRLQPDANCSATRREPSPAP